MRHIQKVLVGLLVVAPIVAQAQWLQKAQNNTSYPTIFEASPGADWQGVNTDGELRSISLSNAATSVSLSVGAGVWHYNTDYPDSLPQSNEQDIALLRQQDNLGRGSWIGTFPPGTPVLTPLSGETIITWWALPLAKGYSCSVQPVSKEAQLIIQARGWNAITKTWSNWIDFPAKRSEKELQYKPVYVALRTEFDQAILGSTQIRVIESNNPLPVSYGMTIPRARL